jgi:hypothetical protein
MKTKKKIPSNTKKPQKKQSVNKPTLIIDKTIATTKEKTYTTLEEPF